MTDLPAAWHEIVAPGRETLEVFVSGGGGDHWDVFQIKDENGAPCPVDGCTIDAEVRGDDNALIATLDAVFTDAALGFCRVSSTAAANAALLPGDTVPRSAPVRLGRYAYFITDTIGRLCIKAGDAYGIRK